MDKDEMLAQWLTRIESKLDAVIKGQAEDRVRIEVLEKSPHCSESEKRPTWWKSFCEGVACILPWGAKK